MKIHLYNYSLPIVFSYCDNVLKQMNYRVHNTDFKRGMISGAKGEGLSSLSSLLDLKFTTEKFSVCITVISGTLSNIFGNIYDDPASENEFIETLFSKLEARKISFPFRESEENLIEALAS